MAKTKQKSKGSKAKAKAEEVAEDVEELEDEVEELADDDEEVSPSKSKKGSDDDVTFGVADLCKAAKKITGKEYSTREMRTLLRKMAREDDPRVDRTITAGNRSRYDWPEGLNDPEVKRVLKAIKGGEIEAGKKEALAKLKEQKAAKAASADKASKKSSKGKSKAKAEETDDDDVEEIEDLDDDDDE